MIKDTSEFLPLKRALERMEQSITTGGELYVGIQKADFFDQKMISMVKVAEETNKTEYVFEKIQRQVLRRHSTKIQNALYPARAPDHHLRRSVCRGNPHLDVPAHV